MHYLNGIHVAFKNTNTMGKLIKNNKSEIDQSKNLWLTNCLVNNV